MDRMNIDWGQKMLSAEISKMDIGKAINLYKEHGSQFYSDSHYLIELFRRVPCEIGIGNDSYIHALGLSELMFNNVQQSLEMLTGKACDMFIEVLSDSFNGALARLKKNGGSARLIVAADEKPLKLSQLEKEYKGTLEVLNAIPKREIGHYIIADSCMVRDEKIHKELSLTDPADTIKAIVHFNNPSKAKSMELGFNAAWNVLKKRQNQLS